MCSVAGCFCFVSVTGSLVLGRLLLGWFAGAILACGFVGGLVVSLLVFCGWWW